MEPDVLVREMLLLTRTDVESYLGLDRRGSLSPQLQDEVQDAEVLGDLLQDGRNRHHSEALQNQNQNQNHVMKLTGLLQVNYGMESRWSVTKLPGFSL